MEKFYTIRFYTRTESVFDSIEALMTYDEARSTAMTELLAKKSAYKARIFQNGRCIKLFRKYSR